MARREPEEEARLRRERQKVAKTPWCQLDALDFIGSLLDAMREAGFGLALGGSLLRGDSKKDLDLIVFPLDASCFDLEKARAVFRSYGMYPLWYRHEIARFWDMDGSHDNKHVEVWSLRDKRIDVFFLK